MTDAELLCLADREYERLTDENYNCAAAIMRALSERVRGCMVERLETDGAEPASPKVRDMQARSAAPHSAPISTGNTGHDQ